MREILERVQGAPAVDGAGVHLVRVLGPRNTKSFDPFLMLDAFDSKNPDDYTKGFPMHPHRGIETFTYLVKGQIDHQDTLNNSGTINSGESQWMTAGSGILHQEMPQAAEHMLGLQLWINLPSHEKMTEPKYFEIDNTMVKEISEEGAKIKLIAGRYLGVDGEEKTTVEGVKGNHLDTDIMDIKIEPNQTITLNTIKEKNLFIYLFNGTLEVGSKQERVEAKTAALFSKGEKLKLKAGEEGAHLFIAAAQPIKEPIAWGGPIVMNTKEELDHAFHELRNNTFIKTNAS